MSISDTFRHFTAVWLEMMSTDGFWHGTMLRTDATTWDINNGQCYDIAQAVINHMGGPTDTLYGTWLDDIKPRPVANSHYVVVHNGRYYDAECPDGVDTVDDLPFVQNQCRPRAQVLAERAGKLLAHCYKGSSHLMMHKNRSYPVKCIRRLPSKDAHSYKITLVLPLVGVRSYYVPRVHKQHVLQRGEFNLHLGSDPTKKVRVQLNE